MENVIVQVNGVNVEIYHLQVTPVYYGHKLITIELFFKNQYKKFSAKTNNMPDCDAASELDGCERYLAYYDIVKYSFEDGIVEWINSL